MGKYFIKNFNWLCIYGEDGVEIYNVEDESDFVVFGKEQSKIIYELLHGKNVDDFEKSMMFKDIIEILKNRNIGKFEDNFYVNSEYKIGKDDIGFFGSRSQLVRTFIEIPSKCDKCEHCEKIFSAGCFSCHKTKSKNKNVKFENYKGILDGLNDLSCREVLLHGADILQEKLTYDIISYLVEKNMEIKLIVHYNMLDETLIKRIKDISSDKLKFIINIDIIEDIDIENIYKRIYVINKKYSLNNKDFSISIRIDKKNCKQLSEIKDNIENQGISVRNVSVISDSTIEEEELESIYLLNAYYYDVCKNLKKYSPCLTGTLSFDTELNVLVCPHMREYVIKNNQGKLNSDENITLRSIWGLATGKIEQCSDCSKRTRCLDCRYIEEKYTGKINGKRVCKYYNNAINNKE